MNTTPSPPRASHVLVIDDDEMFRLYLVDLLQSLGHEVRHEPNGEAGMRAYRERRPALVITDIFMPIQDGVEFILALSKEPDRPPIIAMSGGGVRKAQHDYLRMIRTLGADHVLEKPFSAEALSDAITQHLRNALRLAQ